MMMLMLLIIINSLDENQGNRLLRQSGRLGDRETIGILVVVQSSPRRARD